MPDLPRVLTDAPDADDLTTGASPGRRAPLGARLNALVRRSSPRATGAHAADAEPGRHEAVGRAIPLAAIRRRLSCGFSYAALSQADFARRYGFSPAAVRDWEQGRRKPEASARVLLMLIADQPHLVDEAIRAALDDKPAEHA